MFEMVQCANMIPKLIKLGTNVRKMKAKVDSTLVYFAIILTVYSGL